jgi:DNA replication and repair protein RecF
MSGLSLTSLSLSHFRSHQHLTLVPDDRPVALFGPNGAGKTNVLEAISLLSPGRGLRRATVQEMARKPQDIGWKITASLSSLGHLHAIETGSEAGAPRIVRIDDKTAPQVSLGRVARVVWLVPAMDRLWIEGADGRRRFLDRLTLSFRPKHAESVLAYEKAMRERNRLLKEGVRDPHWFSALEAQMAQSGADIAENRADAVSRLMSAQAGAGTAFPAAALELLRPDGDPDPIWKPADLEAALSEGRQRDMAAGRTLTGPHRSDLGAVYEAKNLPARDCSTGEQKALLLSLILADARALHMDFGAAPLLLLDEVSAHLDADRQRALYDEVCALGAQAWMTGTGPEMFEALGDRAQRFEVTETEGVSQVSPV